MDFPLTITLFMVLLVATVEAAAPLVKPGCQSTCGNVTIPFPFGTKPGCYLEDRTNSFLVECVNGNGSQLYYQNNTTNIVIQDISLGGEMKVLSFIARACFDKSNSTSISSFLRLPKFHISFMRNKFTAVGCNTEALISGRRGNEYGTGCLSLCDNLTSVRNGSCSGIACCQSSIPEGVRDFTINVNSRRGSTTISKNLPCSYAFVVEEHAYNFSSLDLNGLQGKNRFPVVLDWAVGYETCEEAKKNQSSYACKAINSDCISSSNGPGYRCNCSSGFEGNPYLVVGCQDINECNTSNRCAKTATCRNKQGGYSCFCKDGYEGDGYTCTKKSKKITDLVIALGISIGLLALMLGSCLVYFLLAKRKLEKLREKFFEQNGGTMLKVKLGKQERSVQTARIFSAEELKKATNNYHESRVIGHGGFGTVYKGLLSPDNRVVAIKKSKVSDQSQIEQFINEVIILSQINHRNVVKLIGCCLETETPMLVYEFITNGSLSEHIHNKDIDGSSLSWEMRLKIAAETAGAIAYLHSATSTPIIHRDIKSANILLDEKFTAKVADFGASKLMPLDHTQLTTLVQGTFGYLDPEYFHSSQLTEMSDVYSFGVLLAELMTGEKAISFDRSEKDRNLATYFVSSMRSSRGILDIVEKRLLEEENIHQIKAVAILVARCLRVNGDQRPSMKEVAMELEGLKKTVQHPWLSDDSSIPNKETDHLLINQSVLLDTYRFVDDESSTRSYSSTAALDSMKDQMKRQLQLR